MSDLLIAPAYAEIAALKRHFQLLNGSPEALQYLLASTPTPTGAQLETWLATPANLTAFQQLISSPAGAAAVAASSTAMNAVIESSTAMNAVAASSTAMNAVAASSTAMAAVLNSAEARRAVYDIDTAWNAVVASATAKAALLSSSTEHTTNSTSRVYPPGSGVGVRVVLVQQKSNSSTYASYAGANADTYNTTSSTYIDRYVRVTGLTHRGSNSAFYSTIKYIIMQ